MADLTINSYEVKDILLSDSTVYDNGILNVDDVELKTLLMEDGDFKDLRISVTKPGDSARIVHIWDVIEPRTKVDGPGVIFPGWLGPAIGHGKGVINRLSGAAVVTCTKFMQKEDTYLEQRDCIIDMSGPSAEKSPFSQTINLVIECIPGTEISAVDYNKVMALAGVKAAKYLADATKGISPSKTEARPIDLSINGNPDLPNVALLMLIIGSSPSVDTFLFGYSVIGTMPTLLHPNEMAEGALVACTKMVAAAKNLTYLYQNNPLIENLYKHHGTRHNFAGAIIQRLGSHELNDKERMCAHSANLAQYLKADGAIITGESGGHPLVDTMMTCRECEQRGIKTVVMMAEFCGKAGTSDGFTGFVPEADLVVSVGNAEEPEYFPKMDVAYGGDYYLHTDKKSNEEWTVDIEVTNLICGAHSFLGASRVRAVDG